MKHAVATNLTINALNNVCNALYNMYKLRTQRNMLFAVVNNIVKLQYSLQSHMMCSLQYTSYLFCIPKGSHRLHVDNYIYRFKNCKAIFDYTFRKY